jgi:putative membrane protein
MQWGLLAPKAETDPFSYHPLMTNHGPQITNPLLLVRYACGGVLMGLANLVPGISGGTMLLAAGVYRRFVDAIAQVTTFRWSVESILTLVIIVAGAGGAIVLGAGLIRDLVHEHRWVMYSLFLGLTLGGVPLLWSLLRPFTPSAIAGFIGGILFMIFLALLQWSGAGDAAASAEAGNWWMHLIAGLAAGSAMVLPGLSGSYVLLILGQYLVVLGAIEGAKEAVQSGGDLTEPLSVILPVGIGAVVGVVGVSNAVKWLLEHAKKVTLGVLMGLLVGAVLGLWPFIAPQEPIVGDVIRGQSITAEMLRSDQIKPEHWRTELFAPSAGHVASAVALTLVGFACSVGIGLLGGEDEDPEDGSLTPPQKV